MCRGVRATATTKGRPDHKLQRRGREGPPSRRGREGPPSRRGREGPPSRRGREGPPSRRGREGPPSPAHGSVGVTDFDVCMRGCVCMSTSLG